MLNFTNQIVISNIVVKLIKPVFTLLKNIKELFLIPKKGITFVSTVLATLPIRTASQGGSFAFIDFSIIDYVPSKPLFLTFLEGFSFCRKIML
ncbi:type III secretory pathway component EscU [Pedobacter sp. SG908]|nr:type III secretory pathway component EscU [Pedobacter sp. SG908]NMN36092.1 type III secretory pathway component EscU [Pedobacter sp. SG918]